MLKQQTVLFIPTLDDVNNLKVGDNALDCFGRWSRVTDISYRGADVSGNKYVGFYTATGPTSGVSGSYKVSVLVRTVAVSSLLTSRETDDVERYMRTKGERLSSIDKVPRTALPFSKSGY